MYLIVNNITFNWFDEYKYIKSESMTVIKGFMILQESYVSHKLICKNLRSGGGWMDKSSE